MRTNPAQRRVRLAVAALAATSLLLTACGGSSEGDDSASGDGGAKITFIPKNLGNPYFDASDTGGQNAAKEFGGSWEQVGPTDATPDSQVSFINTATQQRTDALVISANDPSAIGGALQDAMDADIPVVTMDSDTEPEYRDLFVSQADTEGIAKAQVDLISEQIGGKGKIAILSASANATNQNAWIEEMEAQLEESHPDIELVETVYGNDDDQESFDKTAGLLQTHQDLKGIISPTTVGLAAAARYLSTSQYKGKVALTGLGTPNQMREYVKNGTVKAFALWDPEELGYLSAYAADALASGEIEGEEGDTFTAGDLGEYTVGEDGVVVLGEPTVFDKSNIDDFDF